MKEEIKQILIDEMSLIDENTGLTAITEEDVDRVSEKLLLLFIEKLPKEPRKKGKVKRSPLTSTNLLAKAINSQKPL
jgi:hypothetical protein